MEGLIGLSELVEQAQALLADSDSTASTSSFLRVVAVGSVVRSNLAEVLQLIKDIGLSGKFFNGELNFSHTCMHQQPCC
jgi:hypothetical protein